MDIPKIYLRKTPKGGIYRYEAVDGQQRLRAIWDFACGELALISNEPLAPVDRYVIQDKRWNDLDDELKRRFEDFRVGIAEIITSTIDEVTNLFARLQMGVPLNPAELRNAKIGPMRHMIHLTSSSHPFFLNCKISPARFKREDFLTHAVAMAAFQGRRDVKAPDLNALYNKYSSRHVDQILKLSKTIGDALNVLLDVDKLTRYRIVRKWIFVDLAWLVMQLQARHVTIDPSKLTSCYEQFEERRLAYISRPDELLTHRKDSTRLDRHLYNYIYAFRTDGGSAKNLKVRNDALRAFCKPSDVAVSEAAIAA
jgi:hypothetical protein